MVAGAWTDVFQVVMLTAHAHNLLGRGGACIITLLKTKKQVLELVHPGVGEKDRFVAIGDERGRRHHFVAVAREIVYVSTANLIAQHKTEIIGRLLIDGYAGFGIIHRLK